MRIDLLADPHQVAVPLQVSPLDATITVSGAQDTGLPPAPSGSMLRPIASAPTM
jgi:hypothetical protein